MLVAQPKEHIDVITNIEEVDIVTHPQCLSSAPSAMLPEEVAQHYIAVTCTVNSQLVKARAVIQVLQLMH